MRRSGVLLHLSSLPSPGGIGTMGQAARDFVDALQESGQSCWQLLPICPTSYGDSPYQTYSTFAGNPYFIDLEELERQGLLESREYRQVDWESTPERVNYGAMYRKRYPILRRAAERFLQNVPEDFEGFCRRNAFWLEDFALFMALKDFHGGVSWTEWAPEYRNRDAESLAKAGERLAEEVSFWRVVQYLFFGQWKALKAYAGEHGITMIGDLPIYVALDSVDVWAHPELFQLDENKVPREVAGCPPDGFAADGQLWGNPLFDWDYMKRDDYVWWVQRIGYLCEVYDILRIDHFRGFDSYYAIPYGETTARNGVWKQGPGIRLFEAVERALGRRPIIAEDLGYLTDSVRQLLRESGFPGMKVMEMAFDSRDTSGSEYLPYNFVRNCVAYTGTHDNDTIVGWFQNADAADAEYAREYLGISEETEQNWRMMDALWASVAELTVVQAQDLLGLGSEARMNRPSTVGNNWVWRAQPGFFTQEIRDRLKRRMRLYGRK